MIAYYYTDGAWWLDAFLLLAGACLALYYFSISTYGYWRDRNVPYARPTPLFGCLLPIVTRRAHMVDEFGKIYQQAGGAKYIGLFQMRTPALMVCDPALIADVLVKDFSHFTDHVPFGDPVKTPLVNHLFNMKGKQWKVMRQKMSPAFTPAKLKLMHGQIAECSAQLMEYLDRTLAESPGDGAVEVRNVLGNYSMDVIGTCAYGLRLNAINDDRSPFRKHGNGLFNQLFKAIFRDLCVMVSPVLNSVLNISDYSKETVEFFTSTLTDTMRHRKENNIVRNDVVKCLMEARTDLVIKKTEPSIDFKEMDIVANAFVMFIAGYETVSTTISFCLYELALNKDIQDRVRREMLSTKAKHDGRIDNEYTNDLRYLETVLEETLRKYPILSVIFRQATEPYRVPGENLLIEKGTRIFIPAYFLHYDSKYYPDPTKFDPERFTHEEKAKRPAGTYMPFGIGPRVCIGKQFAELEMKLALTEIITKYEVEPCHLTDIPMRLSRSSPIISPENGIWLRFKLIGAQNSNTD